MQSEKLAGARPSTNTQQFLDIAEIREDSVILKDGTLRSVLQASSINFALKAEEEQNALIAAYVDFLNSLNYPLQIVIQSRQLNLDNYLADLRQKAKTQTNELLKVQIENYIQYISELVELGDIMTKKFYVIVSYNPASDKTKGFWRRLNETIRPAAAIRLKGKVFDQYKHELDIRIGQVISSLKSMGVNAVQLDTQSLIDLYYNVYNPETAPSEKLADVNKLRVEKEF